MMGIFSKQNWIVLYVNSCSDKGYIGICYSFGIPWPYRFPRMFIWDQKPIVSGYYDFNKQHHWMKIFGKHIQFGRGRR